MSIGFIKLHRKIIEWEWYSDIYVTRLFLHLLVTANFENKKWRGIIIKRGEQVSSYKNLARDTGLSIQQVRTAIKKLKSTHELTSKATKSYTLFHLTNYSVYQDRKNDSNIPPTRQLTNEQQTNNKQVTTTKEGKKERSKEVSLSEIRKISGEILEGEDFEIDVKKCFTWINDQDKIKTSVKAMVRAWINKSVNQIKIPKPVIKQPVKVVNLSNQIKKYMSGMHNQTDFIMYFSSNIVLSKDRPYLKEVVPDKFKHVCEKFNLELNK